MKPAITVITLGVDDLEASLRFYRDGLGWPSEGVVGTEFEHGAVMAKAAHAGANIVKHAHETFWGGYSGYFQDPDGHLWEVVWNPQWSAGEED